MEAEARKTAIDVVGDVPWGTHFCQFYRGKEDLIEILVPYFRSGLENNEFCMWITSEPLSAEQARKALEKEVRDLDDYIDAGQIEILDHSQWYVRAGHVDFDEVLAGWAEKEIKGLERGFKGLRVAGNASWLARSDWERFSNYEAVINDVMGKHRILGLCTYPLHKCTASEIIDVASNHQFALIKQDGQWRTIESPGQKKAHEALRRSEERYAMAQRAANIGGWDWDIETGRLHWSDHIEPLFGFARGEFGGTYQAFLECVHPHDRQHVVDSVDACVEGCDDYAIEHRIVWPDGTIRWVSETGDVTRDESGKAVRMLGVVQDITDYKARQAHEQLAGQILRCLNRGCTGVNLVRDVLKLMKKATGFDAVAIRQREGEDFPYLEVDGFGEDFVATENYLCSHDEAGELIYDSQGRPVIECMCGNVLRSLTDATLPFFTEAGSFWTNSTTELLACTPPEALQVPTRNRCNQAGYESVALIPLRSGDEIVGLLQLNDTRRGRFTLEMIRFLEEIGASIGIGMARIRAEEDLMKYRDHLEELVQIRTAELTYANKKLLQEIEGRKLLEKEILNISEREQRRIGRELHDSIGQQFTGIAFMMKVLEQKLTDKLPEEATDAGEVKKLVNQAMDQMRGLAKGLHPIDLDAGSLMEALQELVATTERMFGIHCVLKCDQPVPIDDAEVAAHLYRITQEAITNAIKHGKAQSVQVELARRGDKNVLTIENDGLDFPEEPEARGTGMGLQIMDHRADIIGASLDIHKAAGDGTIVSCSFRNHRR